MWSHNSTLPRLEEQKLVTVWGTSVSKAMCTVTVQMVLLTDVIILVKMHDSQKSNDIHVTV